MKIDKNDFVTLSDNVKYLVVSKVRYRDLDYFYLVDVVDNSNIKFVTIDNDNVIEVNDNEKI